MHDLLDRQHDLCVVGAFMPHAMIENFFRSDAPVAEMVARPAVAKRAPSLVLDAQHVAGPDSAANAPLQALHEAAIAALLPLAHPACESTPREWHGPRLQLHLTLAMANLPEWLFEEVLALVRGAGPVGPTESTADTVLLTALRSDDWPGAWWDTPRWGPLHSGHLGGPMLAP